VHPVGDVLLFAESCVYLAIARIAVAVLPFAYIAQWMSKPRAPKQSTTGVDRIAVAIERASRRAPWRTVCIHQGISAQRMLRRRGYDSAFVYGLAIPDSKLKAHVWVTVDGRAVTGGHASDGFVAVATFPQASAVSASLDLSEHAR